MRVHEIINGSPGYFYFYSPVILDGRGLVPYPVPEVFVVKYYKAEPEKVSLLEISLALDDPSRQGTQTGSR
jgi:hypothetical protein